MCGRFVASSPPSVLAEQFAVVEITVDVTVAERPPRWNVAPTDEVLAVATRGGVRRLGVLAWGLVPSWSRAVTPGRLPRGMINLRAETVVARPAFRRELQRHRCIIPADGFYEWASTGSGRSKQPYFIAGRDGRPLALAGLWAAWKDPEAVGDDEGWVRTCTIVTTEPNELIAPVHDRMPVVLGEEAWDAWLDRDNDDVEELSSLLVACPAERLTMWPVGAGVNRVQNDGPELVARLAPAG
ncbi:MAG: SOS response-associated peptidase [Acidimicrobiales bacterium]